MKPDQGNGARRGNRRGRRETAVDESRRQLRGYHGTRPIRWNMSMLLVPPTAAVTSSVIFVYFVFFLRSDPP